MSARLIANAKRVLANAGPDFRCKELKAVLEGLGFEVSERTAGHRVYVHPRLPTFHGGNYDCGHGKNPEVKPCYIRNVKRVLESLTEDLIEVLKDGKS